MGSVDLIALMGGMALFLYGMFMTRDGIQHFAGERFKTMITGLASNRFKGLALGALATVALQSSTALTVMLVGLAHAGVITLAQSVPILLGADIGTTVTVQLISFRLERYALLVVTLGFLIMFFGKKRGTKFAGTLVFGFGMIFFGMKLMIEAVEPLKNVATFSQALWYLDSSPMQSLLVAMAFTALIHSSAATIGLVISLAMAGAMNLQTAIPMVLGANIGTSFTALLAGMGSSANGKRIAVAHALLKTAGVALCFPCIDPFCRLVSLTSAEVPRQIANAHTIFNIGFALLILPFSTAVTSLLKMTFTEAEAKEKPFGPIYLDPTAIHTPALALAYVKREVMRMAGIIREMLDGTIRVFQGRNLDLMDEINGNDEKINTLERSVRFYLAGVNKTTYSREQSGRELELVTIASDFEEIGDVMTRTMMADAKKYIETGIHFSPNGMSEISSYHSAVTAMFNSAVAAYDTGDEGLARHVLRERDRLADTEIKLKEAHLERLHKGLRESFDTSSIHIECLSNLGRIVSISARMAVFVINRINDRRLEDAFI